MSEYESRLVVNHLQLNKFYKDKDQMHPMPQECTKHTLAVYERMNLPNPVQQRRLPTLKALPPIAPKPRKMCCQNKNYMPFKLNLNLMPMQSTAPLKLTKTQSRLSIQTASI